MAKEFLIKSNGETIYPKTVAMLQKYYKRWKLNQQIKMFQKQIKKFSNITNELKNQRVTTPSTRKIKPPKKFPKK